MAGKTPPIRVPFFDFSVEIAQENPNLQPVTGKVQFDRTTTEWVAWATAMSNALGFHVDSLTKTASLDFPLIAANGGTQDLTVTVTGVKALDPQSVVCLGLPSGLTAGLVFHGFVSANDTVTVRATNTTAGAIDPAAFTCRVEVRRF